MSPTSTVFPYFPQRQTMSDDARVIQTHRSLVRYLSVSPVVRAWGQHRPVLDVGRPEHWRAFEAGDE